MFYRTFISYGFDWKGQSGWEVEVKIGKLDTIIEATHLGFDSQWLLHFPKTNYLLLLDGIGKIHHIEAKDVILKKQKPESFKKLMIEESDFSVIEVSKEDFLNLPENFYSLYYRVIQEK